MKKITCPMNPKTKERLECNDCPLRDDCIQDLCDDFEEYVIKAAAKLGKKITKLLKEKRGI
uniref:Transposase n=1 Tax=viral metagenome TaxID=1070528 RepID=A0A6H2A466_9ZZZZ